jgi:hypothetical protein
MARKAKTCTCAPCCRCGYAGQDSDGADCYVKSGPSIKKGGGTFYGEHCFCWYASEAECPAHGSPEALEILEDLEPCPNSPYRIKDEPTNLEKEYGREKPGCGACAALGHDCSQHGGNLDGA